MKKLLALLAAIGAVVFFWRKKQAEDDSWDTAGTTSSWGEAASDTLEDAGDKAEDAADAAADAVDDATS